MPSEEDRRITEVVEREQSRLRNFIRRRVGDPRDAEDILQDVFSRLVEANRLLMPIDHVTGWLFRVARNRITDLFRRKTPERFSDLSRDGVDDDAAAFEELLPSADDGPEAAYVRALLIDELEAALADLPAPLRSVFIAHEIEGQSFKDIAASTGINLNTLLSRKRQAVLQLRARLERIHDDIEAMTRTRP